MLFFFYVYRSLLARLRANVVTVLSVALFVTGSLLGVAVYASLSKEMVETVPAQNVLVIGDGAASEGSSRMTLENARKLQVLPGLASASGRPLAAMESLTSVYITPNDDAKFQEPVPLRGIDETSMLAHGATLVEGTAPTPGSLELIIGTKVARKYGNAKIGQDLYLPAGPAKIVGIFTSKDGPLENEVWTPRSAFDLHLKATKINSLTLVAESPEAAKQLVAKINASKDFQAQAIRVKDYRARAAGLSTILRLVLIVLILLSSVATVAIAVTMNAAVAIRLVELASLVAIGFRKNRVARMVVLESMLLAVVGAVLGIIATYVLGSQVSAVPVSNNEIDLALPAILPLVGIALGVVVGIVGGIAPMLTIRRLDISQTVR